MANTRKLSMYLSKWCKANGFACGVHFGKEFEYDFDKACVSYCLNENNNQDRLFRQVFIDEGLTSFAHDFIISFFHELGHLMTEENWSEAESDKFMDYKETLDGSTLEGNINYFYTPDEIMATRWAIDYINNNYEKIEELWKNVQRLRKEINK